MSLINVAVVGAGMFGGSVVKVASELNIPGVVLNASKDDIDALELSGSNEVTTFVIGDGNGTGKNRDIAKEFLADHISVFDESDIENLVGNADLIIVAGSASGGFGSGIVPLTIQVLNEKFNGEKLFIAMTTLPCTDEQYIPHYHTSEFLKEIFEQEIPYIIYDNEKVKGRNMYHDTLDTIKRDLKLLRGDYVVNGTVIGANMDPRDILTVCSTPGRIVMGLIDPFTGTGNVIDAIKENITNSVHADIEDDKVIFASATSYCLTDETIDVNNIKGDLVATFGDHISDYANECLYEGLGTPFASVILAGCSAPNKRIDQIVDIATKKGNIITSRRASTSNKLMSATNDNHIKLGVKTFGSSAPVQKKSVADIMKKLNK